MSEEPTAGVPQTPAQASGVTFELHTLGWEAFQNLCGCVLREILGQTYTVFSSTNDAGQDGAFQGTWKQEGQETYSGRFVVQCKFTCRRDSHLSLSDLEDELGKAKRLAKGGHVETYLLMTNAKVSGESALRIHDAFLAITEIKHFRVLGGEWLTEKIRESRKLRALVPRIYGLGDLSQILDERVYRQANELLQSWKENLAKFVPTNAHRRSVEALQTKRFVLLLGDPMAGKSTISAALALAAADSWKCPTIFATTPEEFKQHWNPDEPNQFFWIDDAFGQTQYNEASAEGWNRVFPFLASAVKKGTRVIFTSRTNIFNAAKRNLKLASFPLLNDSQVVVEVEKLGLHEKKRILYNHLRMGEQPQTFRAEIKPYLDTLSERPKFLPEIARRLGNPLFTNDLYLSETRLSEFVDAPKQFLVDVIRQSGRAEFAGLALLFMRSGKITIPIELDAKEEAALWMIHGDIGKIREALKAQENVLVKKSYDSSGESWKFSHPTIREAIAAIISDEEDLLDIYLAGARWEEVVSECACGVPRASGAKIFVPESRFHIVMKKLRCADFRNSWEQYSLCRFFAKRCSKAFLRIWVVDYLSDHHRFLDSFTRPATNHSFCLVLSRLKDLDLLEEDYRQKFLKSLRDSLEYELDPTGLDDELSNLVEPDERREIVHFVESEVLPGAHNVIADHEYQFDPETDDPDDYLRDLDSNLESFNEIFHGNRGLEVLVDIAIEDLTSATERLKEKAHQVPESQLKDSESLLSSSPSGSEIAVNGRSIFDDVDA